MRIKQAGRMSGLAVLCAACWASNNGLGQASLGQASPETPFVVGQLTCTMVGESEADSAGVAQGQNVLCQFRPGISGPEETYTGTLQGAGRVKALFGDGTLMLVVKQFGSGQTTPGMLAQDYSADAAVRGGRVAPLIGDRNNAVVLQPMMSGEARKQGEAFDALIVVVQLQLQSSAG